MKITNEMLQTMLEKSKKDFDLDLGFVKLYYNKKDLELSVIYTYSSENLEAYLEVNDDFKNLSKSNIELIYNFSKEEYEIKLQEELDDINTWTNWSGMGTPIN